MVKLLKMGKAPKCQVGSSELGGKGESESLGNRGRQGGGREEVSMNGVRPPGAMFFNMFKGNPIVKSRKHPPCEKHEMSREGLCPGPGKQPLGVSWQPNL